MDVTIYPRRLRGTLTPPPSKSMAHRVVLAELLAGKDTFSVSASLSEDIRATVSCADALRDKLSMPLSPPFGGRCHRQATEGGGETPPPGADALLSPPFEGRCRRQATEGGGETPPPGADAPPSPGGGGQGNFIRTVDKLPVLDCGESGSTLRFLIPVALVLRGGGVFTGHGRLLQRPLEPYRNLCREKGLLYEQSETCLTVRGLLTPGEYHLPGDVSSQFITGLLFALPLLPGDSVIRLTSPLESSAYVDMTLDVLHKCGVVVACPDAETFLVPGRQRYRADNLSVEADWSQAAFWCAANFLGNHVKLLGLNPASVQGDRVIVKLFRKMSNPNPVPIEIDLSGIPDLFPPLAVMAAWHTLTHFTHAGRLRLKESDRLDSIENLLRAFGVAVRSGADWMTVDGGLPDSGEPLTLDGNNDHRIVMAAAVLASVWDKPVTIRGAEAVNKSYPDFFTHYQQLGGKIRVL